MLTSSHTPNYKLVPHLFYKASRSQHARTWSERGSNPLCSMTGDNKLIFRQNNNKKESSETRIKSIISWKIFSEYNQLSLLEFSNYFPRLYNGCLLPSGLILGFFYLFIKVLMVLSIILIRTVLTLWTLRSSGTSSLIIPRVWSKTHSEASIYRRGPGLWTEPPDDLRPAESGSFYE